MSVPAAVFLVVGLIAIGVLAAVLVWLVKHVRLLAGSLAELQRAAEPVLRDIRAEAERAQETADRLVREASLRREERERKRRTRTMRRGLRRQGRVRR
ncbi:MAG: hypothetical protein HY658_14705 [Actinobacteria bacterium]|nr:hypothetical protein [Actinomycetota bacterium]